MGGGYSQQGYRPPRPPTNWGPPGPPTQQPGYGYMQPGASPGQPPEYNMCLKHPMEATQPNLHLVDMHLAGINLQIHINPTKHPQQLVMITTASNCSKALSHHLHLWVYTAACLF